MTSRPACHVQIVQFAQTDLSSFEKSSLKTTGVGVRVIVGDLEGTGDLVGVGTLVMVGAGEGLTVTTSAGMPEGIMVRLIVAEGCAVEVAARLGDARLVNKQAVREINSSARAIICVSFKAFS
jgi:hypothetical protein